MTLFEVGDRPKVPAATDGVFFAPALAQVPWNVFLREGRGGSVSRLLGGQVPFHLTFWRGLARYLGFWLTDAKHGAELSLKFHPSPPLNRPKGQLCWAYRLQACPRRAATKESGSRSGAAPEE